MTSIPNLIIKKRDGKELTPNEISILIKAYTEGNVPDYQMAALAMAIFFEGMVPREITALTLAMRDSGQIVNLDHIKAAKVDKHSTGGVGDKVSICLAPMVAACGVAVPMISGRGLGHTGGTLDKLEAIPGFKVGMSVAQFIEQMTAIGCSLIGQTAELAPADKKLYALRDVTGTVESIPLITASILSKKLAEGIDSLVLDVKVGTGAFMKNERNARALARSIVRVGKLAGKKVSALLTCMDHPLGLTIGNAIETQEALELLHGRGPNDLKVVTMALGAEMLRLAGVAKDKGAAIAMLEDSIKTGSARAKMKQIIAAQGGDADVVDDPNRLALSSRQLQVKASAAGYVRKVDPYRLAMTALSFGAGRQQVTDSIDPSVGIRLGATLGTAISKGDVLATLYLPTDRSIDERGLADEITASFVVGEAKPRPRVLIRGQVR